MARAVSSQGQLGVVSGTALDQICARRLQDGDPGGHLAAAFAAFPFPAMAARVWTRYYRPGGKREKEAYLRLPMQAKDNPRELQELCILANFAEIWLARQGHARPVGINYLEKIQIPHLPSLYGSMLAGVDFVLMGAGVPLKIPGILDCFVSHQAATYPLHVTGAQSGNDVTLRFDPRDYYEGAPVPLVRPHFLAIVSSSVLAATLLAKANGCVDGFIVEGPTAGGHNAPPRGRLQLSPAGEPIYGERDCVELDKLRALGRPFWLAGGCGSRAQLLRAQAEGAAGVQVGTAFAFCSESGLRPDYREAVLADVVAGRAGVFTDPNASPTGFPFKVLRLSGTLSDSQIYQARPRVCDLGYLREAYRTPQGAIGFRCPAEPVSLYVAKGGRIEDTHGKRCLCNGLIATHGHPQVRAHRHVEPGVVTSGDAIADIRTFLPPGALSYAAADVLSALLPDCEAAPAASTGDGMRQLALNNP
ncbi:MAG TPA: nitronate monooxygenase [Terriglobales bacterium]|nr:nitronate monooxygenase [Terriglobales bacterium]